MEFEIPENARKFVRHAKFRQDPINNKLDTESGKIQIFLKNAPDFKLADFKGHPTWFESAEWLGSKMAEIYPFHLISPHPKYVSIHSLITLGLGMCIKFKAESL